MTKADTQQTTGVKLIPPYGGRLVNLLAATESLDDLKAWANTLTSLQLSERSVCDLELLAVGAFSPLDRFIGAADHESILETMRRTDGSFCPIPITLPVPVNSELHLDRDVALRDGKNDLLGVMTVQEIYEWDLAQVAHKVFQTTDLRHPLIVEMYRWGKLNISGELRVLKLPTHYDFRELRLTPTETRRRLEKLGRGNVVAFQTRNPLHRAHEEMTKRAIEQKEATLLLHPAIGLTKPGDVDHYTRVRTYKVLANNCYDQQRIVLSLLPVAMRMAGPREALWHAVIRRNYGANHIIIGRDHASPGLNSNGQPFYAPYGGQHLVGEHAKEIGVDVIPFREFMYAPDRGQYEEVSDVQPDSSFLSLSGSRVREEYLNRGKRLPEWFTRREVAEILFQTYPPRHKQGVCVWFTGLSGAGKSTTAEILTIFLLEKGRQVTLLDGDVIRTHLSQGLSFSKEDRDMNIRRIGFVAAEIVRHGGAVICAAVSPYRATRSDVRNMVGDDRFIEVFVDTPLDVCEARDTKGMYAKARRGEISNFTGISDVYETPEHPEIVLDGTAVTPEQNALIIIQRLIDEGFVEEEQLNAFQAASSASVSLET